MLRLRSALRLSVVWLLGLAACAPAAPSAGMAVPGPATLTVFAAASLTDAFTEVGRMFEDAKPGVTVVFNFGASNQLAQQINEGAPADVFASANRAQMDVAIAGGGIVSGTQQTFARNRLLVIFPDDNPGGVETLQGLARPGLKLVLASAEAPVGQYSLDFLDKAAQRADLGPAFKDAVLANVVSHEENVRAVFTKVALGEADAGIVYSSDIVGQSSEDVGRLDIPDDLNTIATYPIAALAGARQAALAQAFIDQVLSPAGQAVMAKYGFITV